MHDDKSDAILSLNENTQVEQKIKGNMWQILHCSSVGIENIAV